MISGVRHYIGASWKIPDEMSLYGAREFYAQVIKGESVGEALRRARLRLIKDFGEGAFVWASYVLYGDPTIVLASKPLLKRVNTRFGTLLKKKMAIAGY